MNKIFKALSDSTRRDILRLLNQKDMTAGEIAEKFDITKPSISHHLEVLKNAELVTSKKKGQFTEYSINLTAIQLMMTWFMDFNNEKGDE